MSMEKSTALNARSRKQLSPEREPRLVVPRVLIVEDDIDSAKSFEALLRQCGYDTRCANDGANGLAAAAQFDPHFVLLDLHLPRVHGADVARHLRVNEDGMRRVIIATTGTPRDMVSSSEFDRHLLKPIQPDELLAVLADEWSVRFVGTPWCY